MKITAIVLLALGVAAAPASSTGGAAPLDPRLRASPVRQRRRSCRCSCRPGRSARAGGDRPSPKSSRRPTASATPAQRRRADSTATSSTRRRTAAPTPRTKARPGRSPGGSAAIWIAGASIGVGAIVAGLIRLSWLASRAAPDHLRRLAGHRRPHLAGAPAAAPGRAAAERAPEPARHLGNPAAEDHPSRRGASPGRSSGSASCSATSSPTSNGGDWAVQVAAELLKSIYWFNPVFWIVGRRLRLESEHACDDAVVNSGIDGSDYASHLVDLARALNQQPRTWLPAPAIARPSSLYRRVSAMLNAHLNRRPIPRSLRTAVAAALLAITVAVAAAQAPFATVSGSVVDSTGGFIPGATLTLSSTQSQTKHEVKTDATGRFELVGLPGRRISCSRPSHGFRDLARNVHAVGRPADVEDDRAAARVAAGNDHGDRFRCSPTIVDACAPRHRSSRPCIAAGTASAETSSRRPSWST